MGDRVGPGYEPVNDLPQVQVEKTSGMFLRQTLAEGETEAGEKFEVCSVIPNGSILVKFGAGTKEQYLLRTKKVVDAVINYREKRAARASWER